MWIFFSTLSIEYNDIISIILTSLFICVAAPHYTSHKKEE